MAVDAVKCKDSKIYLQQFTNDEFIKIYKAKQEHSSRAGDLRA